MKYAAKVAFVVVLFYGLIYATYFWKTPLGQTPVLDGSENVLLAQQISCGVLPKEPFYRSMLYPAILSIFHTVGFEATEELFWLASLLGVMCHFISSALVFYLIRNIWKNQKAAIAGMLLYGLYTPAVFFAAEPFDITISITFMLASVLSYMKGIDTKQNRWFLLSGILLGISGLLRSNILPAGIIFITYPLFNRKYSAQSFIAIMSVAIMLGLGGIVNYYHCGEFRLLPWQGASNLYSANSKNANGKFFKHSIYIPDRKAGTNPTRLESEIIYAKETGKKVLDNIDEFNSFWTHKTISEILSEPAYWLELNLKKLYFIFNNYEQYNNKTFGFHKMISPPLRYNPLCFGILTILFFTAISNLKNCADKTKQYTIVVGIIFLSLGILGFYVSARFRLVITPLMVIIGAGLFRHSAKDVFSFKNCLVATIIGFLSFSNYLNVSDTSTWREDRLLNAYACSRLGYDEEQLLWAERVLEEDPRNLQAIRLKIVAFTNMALNGKFNSPAYWDIIKPELEHIVQGNLFFPDVILLAGCYSYNFERNSIKAKNIWLRGGAESQQIELFQACLIYSSLQNPTPEDVSMAKQSPILAAALKSDKFEERVELSKAKTALEFLLP